MCWLQIFFLYFPENFPAQVSKIPPSPDFQGSAKSEGRDVFAEEGGKSVKYSETCLFQVIVCHILHTIVSVHFLNTFLQFLHLSNPNQFSSPIDVGIDRFHCTTT